MARYAYERLSAQDGSFLVFEKPTALMHVAATLIFAGAIPWKTEIFPSVVYLTSQSAPEVALAASLIAAMLSIAALTLFKLVAGRRR